jgi:hypothetical protein
MTIRFEVPVQTQYWGRSPKGSINDRVQKNCCSTRRDKNDSPLREIVERRPAQRNSESTLSVPFLGRFRFGAQRNGNLERFSLAQDGQVDHFAGFQPTDHAQHVARAVNLGVIHGQDDVLR